MNVKVTAQKASLKKEALGKNEKTVRIMPLAVYVERVTHQGRSVAVKKLLKYTWAKSISAMTPINSDAIYILTSQESGKMLR
jgi:hypothetical protein